MFLKFIAVLVYQHFENKNKEFHACMDEFLTKDVIKIIHEYSDFRTLESSSQYLSRINSKNVDNVIGSVMLIIGFIVSTYYYLNFSFNMGKLVNILMFPLFTFYMFISYLIACIDTSKAYNNFPYPRTT